MKIGFSTVYYRYKVTQPDLQEIVSSNIAFMSDTHFQAEAAKPKRKQILTSKGIEWQINVVKDKCLSAFSKLNKNKREIGLLLRSDELSAQEMQARMSYLQGDIESLLSKAAEMKVVDPSYVMPRHYDDSLIEASELISVMKHKFPPPSQTTKLSHDSVSQVLNPVTAPAFLDSASVLEPFASQHARRGPVFAPKPKGNPDCFASIQDRGDALSVAKSLPGAYGQNAVRRDIPQQEVKPDIQYKFPRPSSLPSTMPFPAPFSETRHVKETPSRLSSSRSNPRQRSIKSDVRSLSAYQRSKSALSSLAHKVKLDNLQQGDPDLISPSQVSEVASIRDNVIANYAVAQHEAKVAEISEEEKVKLKSVEWHGQINDELRQIERETERASLKSILEDIEVRKETEHAESMQKYRDREREDEAELELMKRKFLKELEDVELQGKRDLEEEERRQKEEILRKQEEFLKRQKETRRLLEKAREEDLERGRQERLKQAMETRRKVNNIRKQNELERLEKERDEKLTEERLRADVARREAKAAEQRAKLLYEVIVGQESEAKLLKSLDHVTPTDLLSKASYLNPEPALLKPLTPESVVTKTGEKDFPRDTGVKAKVEVDPNANSGPAPVRETPVEEITQLRELLEMTCKRLTSGSAYWPDNEQGPISDTEQTLPKQALVIEPSQTIRERDQVSASAQEDPSTEMELVAKKVIRDFLEENSFGISQNSSPTVPNPNFAETDQRMSMEGETTNRTPQSGACRAPNRCTSSMLNVRTVPADEMPQGQSHDQHQGKTPQEGLRTQYQNRPPMPSSHSIRSLDLSGTTEMPYLPSETFFALLNRTFRMSRTPPPIPLIFTGKPMEYVCWRRSITHLIDQDVTEAEKLAYLQQYMSETVRQSVKAYFQDANAASSVKILEELDKRYGDQYALAQSYLEELNEWPNIKDRDPVALRNFSDILSQTAIVSRHSKFLSSLNEPRQVKILSDRLPESHSKAWKVKVSKYKEENDNSYPPFQVFASFVKMKSNIENDPVYSAPRTAPGGGKASTTNYPPRGNAMSKTSRATNLRHDASEIQEIKDNMSQIERRIKTLTTQTKGEQTGHPSTDTPQSGIPDSNPTRGRTSFKHCHDCRSGDHWINQCSSFQKLDLNQRLKKVLLLGLCFRCLGRFHTAARCKRNIVCDCKEEHHPLLHMPDFDRKAKQALADTRNERMDRKQRAIKDGAYQGNPKDSRTENVKHQTDQREHSKSWNAPYTSW